MSRDKLVLAAAGALILVGAGVAIASDAHADTANGFTVTTDGLNAQNKLHLGSCFTVTYTNNRYGLVDRNDNLVGSDGTAHNYPWPAINAPDQATVALCPQSTGHWVETLTGLFPVGTASGDRGNPGTYNLDVWVVQ